MEVQVSKDRKAIGSAKNTKITRYSQLYPIASTDYYTAAKATIYLVGWVLALTVQKANELSTDK